MGPIALVVLLISALLLAGISIFLAKIIATKSTNLQKGNPYECGVPTIGNTWIQFKIGYYFFALIFIIFSVEIVYLFPWAVTLKHLGITAFIEVAIFLFVLLLGLLYAWKKGVLKWE